MCTELNWAQAKPFDDSFFATFRPYVDIVFRDRDDTDTDDTDTGIDPNDIDNDGDGWVDAIDPVSRNIVCR